MVKTKKTKAKRKLKFGTYSLIIMAGIIVSLFLLNYFVFLLDDNYNLSIDMSLKRLYSLSSETKTIINSLEEDIYIYITETEGYEDVNTEELLKNYKSESGKIHIANIDIVTNPVLMDYYNEASGSVIDTGVVIISNSPDTNAETQRYKILKYDDLYLYNEDTEEYDEFIAEDAITGSIKYIINPGNKKIWLLDGHNPESGAVDTICTILQEENYDFEMLNLLGGQNPLESGDIVIIMSPESDLTLAETQTLDGFLSEGGRLLMGIDETVRETVDFTNLISLIEEYNIELGQGIIRETDLDNTAVVSSSESQYSYIIPQILDHEITAEFLDGGYKIVLGRNSGYIILPEKINESGLSVEAVLETYSTSFAQQRGGNMDEEPDSSGAFGEYVVMAAVERKSAYEEAYDLKAVITTAPGIFTDSQALSMSVYKNKDFLIKCIAWLADDEDDFYISGKSLIDSPLMIETMSQAYFIIIMVSVVIPLLIFLVGIIVFVTRNNL